MDAFIPGWHPYFFYLNVLRTNDVSAALKNKPLILFL